jgi:uncharacterized protein
VRQARAPGAREARWLHLLCGDVPREAAPSSAPLDEPQPSALAALEARVAALEQQVAALQHGAASDQLD